MKINPVLNSIYSYGNVSLKSQNVSNPTKDNFNAQNSSNPIKELSNVYYLPVSFTSSQNRTVSTSKTRLKEYSGDFLVSKMNDIPCPACGKKMMNKRLYAKIEEDLAGLPSEQYLDYLGQYTEYMRPVEESVYNELCELSEKTGNKDVRKLVVQLRNQKLPLLQSIQRRQVKKIRALAKTLPEDERAILLHKASALEEIICNKKEDAPFRRKIMLDGMKHVQIRNPHKYNKLQQIASEFPVSSDMNSAWIVKYSGKNKKNEDWSSKDIALRLLASSVANTDHILAYSIDNNHDDISNYMSMHNACNSRKGNKSFLEWLNEDKANRIKYMQSYFETVDGLIKSKKIAKKKYRHYVAYATETIFEASKGQVQIKIDEDKSKEKETKEEDSKISA